MDDLRHQVLIENACCCYNNEIIAWTQDPVLDREDYCCDVPNENCNTYYIIIFRTATPQAIPDAINNWDGQHVTFTPWSKNTIDRWCYCEGGAATWCNWVLRSGTIYSFDCNPCP